MSGLYEMSPFEALTTVLDEDHARGVIEFRQKTIKKPLSEFAAKLLAKELAKAPDPNAAAEEMVLRNWRGFKADWLQPKGQQRQSVGSVFGNLAAQMERDDGVRRIQGDEGVREAFPLLSFAFEQPERS